MLIIESIDIFFKGKHITVKVKTVDFEVKNRSQSLMSGISTSQEIFAVARELLQTEIRACSPRPLSLRLMGIIFLQFYIYRILQKCAFQINQERKLY